MLTLEEDDALLLQTSTRMHTGCAPITQGDDRQPGSKRVPHPTDHTAAHCWVTVPSPPYMYCLPCHQNDTLLQTQPICGSVRHSARVHDTTWHGAHDKQTSTLSPTTAPHH